MKRRFSGYSKELIVKVTAARRHLSSCLVLVVIFIEPFTIAPLECSRWVKLIIADFTCRILCLILALPLLSSSSFAPHVATCDLSLCHPTVNR